MRLKRILVVDNVPQHLKSLSSLLEVKGYNPTPCKSAHEAVEHVKGKMFCLGLLSIPLQDMDSVDLINEIRRRNPFAGLIFITDSKDIIHIVKAVKYQPWDILLKPVNPELLNHSLETAQGLFKEGLKDRIRVKALERMVRQSSKQLIEKERTVLSGKSLQDFMQGIIDPLTVIIGSAELMKSELNSIMAKDFLQQEAKASGDNEYSETLQAISRLNLSIDKIHNNSQRIYQVLDRALISSLEERTEKSRKIDINDLILKQMEFFKSDLHFKYRIKKYYYLDPFLEKVNISYSCLYKVLKSLIKNAIIAMNNSPVRQLTIATYQDEKYVYISVHDTGGRASSWMKTGKGEPLLEKGEFKCNETARQAVSDGQRLELCRELLRPYYGEIELKSQGEKGSTFTIFLPHYLSEYKPDREIWMMCAAGRENSYFNKGDL